MREFIAAEETGRRNGTCREAYDGCPVRLIEYLEEGIAYLDSGLSSDSIVHSISQQMPF